METQTPEIILHHYEASPFSEKVRLMLGIKSLPWRSVIQPNMMPKPDLVPLTGGYRRAPVMQIGADIFCDSQVMLAEIEQRFPSQGAKGGLPWAVNLWADRLFFQTTVPIIFGELGDKVPRAFIEDREKLSGRPFDVAAMKAASAPMKGQWRGHAAWIESALKDSGGPFLRGAAPGLADAAAYMNIWFLARAVPHVFAELMAGMDAVAAWRDRLAAIGHGARTEMTGAEALEIARTSTPATRTDHDVNDPLARALGAPVTVSADDYGRDPVAGTLVAATPERVVIAREDADLGALNVHFPRVGYVVLAA
jgi:glutathione S-transferase